jgi:hypothetical protein
MPHVAMVWLGDPAYGKACVGGPFPRCFDETDKNNKQDDDVSA